MLKKVSIYPTLFTSASGIERREKWSWSSINQSESLLCVKEIMEDSLNQTWGFSDQGNNKKSEN